MKDKTRLFTCLLNIPVQQDITYFMVTSMIVLLND